MAGGKLSPRQRMINLMYLIFIAMLAMNMSKEVLSAFGLMNERITEANVSATQRNNAYMDGLAQKAIEQKDKYEPLKAKASEIVTLSNEFDSYLEQVKTGLKSTVKESDLDSKNYEVMDKTDYFDIHFFKGDNYTEAGQEFLSKINTYREEVKAMLGEEKEFDFTKIIGDLDTKFHTNDEPRRDGVKVPWLNYHYQGFPMIASLTKLTQMQADVKATANEILSTMLEGQMAVDLSANKYTTLLESPRSAFFQGDTFDGSIVLGRKDATSRPNRVELTLDGRPLASSDYTIEDGRVKLNVSAGNAGEHKLQGRLIFVEGGEDVPVDVELSFTTISQPTDAIISADKMNVLYRGVKNPITISMAGVTDNNITAGVSVGTLTKLSGSKHEIDVTTAQGREVTFNVTGKIGDKSIPSKATFRIKDIPRPVGTVRGEDGILKMQRGNLEIATIGAALLDFDFDLRLEVTSFKFNVPGQPTISVNGSKLNPQAIDVLRRARRGETVQIFDINARIAGNTSYLLPKISPVFVELTN